MGFQVTFRSGARRPRLDFARAARSWAAEVEPLALAALRQAAPVGKGPGAGRLRSSIGARRTATATDVVLTFTSSAPYTPFVIGGTKPHEIVPRRASVLAWEGPNGPTFAARVNHPGTRPNPFPQRALEPLSASIRARLAAIVAEQLNT
jgi:hypothetical protein